MWFPKHLPASWWLCSAERKEEERQSRRPSDQNYQGFRKQAVWNLEKKRWVLSVGLFCAHGWVVRGGQNLKEQRFLSRA
jgi:hypothetical protein